MQLQGVIGRGSGRHKRAPAGTFSLIARCAELMESAPGDRVFRSIPGCLLVDCLPTYLS